MGMHTECVLASLAIVHTFWAFETVVNATYVLRHCVVELHDVQ